MDAEEPELAGGDDLGHAPRDGVDVDGLGILALDAFVYMQALNPNGGPDNTTRTMSQELFNTAFRKGQFGYATAMGVVLAVVTLLFAVIVFAVNRLTGGGERRRSR